MQVQLLFGLCCVGFSMGATAGGESVTIKPIQIFTLREIPEQQLAQKAES